MSPSPPDVPETSPDHAPTPQEMRVPSAIVTPRTLPQTSGSASPAANALARARRNSRDRSVLIA